MVFTRSSKCHFNLLTKKKRSELHSLMEEYSTVVNYFITAYESQISETHKYKLMTAEHIKLAPTSLSARLKKNAFQEGYGMVYAAKEAAKELGEPYRTPKHYGKRMILSSTNASWDLNPSTKGFDLNVEIGCTGRSKISIPLKKHKHFLKWYNLGKLSTSITISKTYIQFSFKVKTDLKKKEGRKIGMDQGINTLFSLSDGTEYGKEYRRLLEILLHKKKYSKGYYRAKSHVKQFIDEMVKKLPKDIRLLVIEDLKGIKNRMKVRRRLTKNIRRFVSNWNTGYVRKRITGWTEENRVSLRTVNPHGTSITCPNCGHRDKKNRSAVDVFKCLKCGHEESPHILAGKNILSRFLTGPYGACFQPV